MIRFEGARLARRLFHHGGDREHLALLVADADDAVLIDAFHRHFLDGDDVGALAELGRGVDHLRQAAALVLHQHVGQKERERLVADQFARTPHRVAQAERLLLAGEAGRARLGQIVAQHVERGLLLALEERDFQLELAVEMILDDALVASGDEDEMLDASLTGLVDHDLDERPVDHRQHLLGHSLGGGQEPGTETGHGKYSFANSRCHGGCR